jgi:hypothetical protein
MFLDCLEEDNSQIVEFAAAGICNMCLGTHDRVASRANGVTEPRVATLMREADGIAQLIRLLSSPNMNTLLSAILALLYLTTPETRTSKSLTDGAALTEQ